MKIGFEMVKWDTFEKKRKLKVLKYFCFFFNKGCYKELPVLTRKLVVFKVKSNLYIKTTHVGGGGIENNFVHM